MSSRFLSRTEMESEKYNYFSINLADVQNFDLNPLQTKTLRKDKEAAPSAHFYNTIDSE